MIIIKKILNLVLLFCLCIGISIHFKDSWATILQEVLQTSPIDLVALFIITILYFIFDSLITFTLTSRYHDKITFKDCLFCSFYCTFLGIATMGSGAGIGEVHYFHNHGISSAVASGICIIKYVIKKIIIVSYGILGFLLLQILVPTLLAPYRIYVLIGTLLALLTICFLLALLTWTWFSHHLFTILKRYITYQKLHMKILVVEQDIHIFQKESKKILKDYNNMIPISILNLCKLTCIYLFPVFHFLTSIPINSYFTILMIMAVCNMLAGVIPTPYGIGSLEFVSLILFAPMINDSKIVSMLLLFRFFSDVFPLIIGGICFLQTKRLKTYLPKKL